MLGAMASDNLELLKEVYECWRTGDFHTEQAYADGFTITMGRDFPDAGVHAGKDGTAAYMKGFLEPWKSLTIEAEGMTEFGDRVLVRVLQSGTGASSGIATELRYFQLWTFAEGKPVTMETVMHEGEARAKLEAP
jgi:ketosteroid isomerase-like protein